MYSRDGRAAENLSKVRVPGYSTGISFASPERTLLLIVTISSMSARVIVGITGLAGVSLCGLVADLIHQEMVIRVNEMLPKESQFSQLAWHFPKTLRLSREYRRLYPEGKLLWVHRVFGIGMFGCLLCVGWAVGLFHAFVEHGPP